MVLLFLIINHQFKLYNINMARWCVHVKLIIEFQLLLVLIIIDEFNFLKTKKRKHESHQKV